MKFVNKDGKWNEDRKYKNEQDEEKLQHFKMKKDHQRKRNTSLSKSHRNLICGVLSFLSRPQICLKNASFKGQVLCLNFKDLKPVSLRVCWLGPYNFNCHSYSIMTIV